MLLNPNFQHDEAQYEASERLWRELWNEQRSSADWSTPWLRTAFSDGQPLRDGNPIFSALSRPAGRAVKVVQVEAGESPASLSAWVKEMEDGNGALIFCLTIHCVLSDSTAETAKNMLRNWLMHQGHPSAFETDVA